MGFSFVKIDLLFATPIYQARLMSQPKQNLNFARLCMDAITDIKKFDLEGRRWCKKNYANGFTSYGSWDNLHQRLSVCADLKNYIDAHVKKFVRTLGWDLQQKNLLMSEMWVNILEEGGAHGSHIHPLSVLSGTYYPVVSEKDAPIIFEDPRSSFKMASPRTKKDSSHVAYAPSTGSVILFESWLRHEVPFQRHNLPRPSISFNYHWL